MHQRLLDLLICPRCLPMERPLRATVHERRGEEIVAAILACPSCASPYPIRNGLATLLAAPPAGDSYASAQRLSAYAWSHYADLEGDPEAHQGFAAWSRLLDGCGGPALDAGCAVGRLSFELARQTDLVVGVDLSAGFIEAARTLARTGRLDYAVVVEGELTAPRTIRLPAGIPHDRVEFVQADAQALPFPAGLFATATSLNLLDRVPAPRRHLAEMNRVTRRCGATLLVADPWSWSESPAPPAAWLGGRMDGNNAGPALALLERTLTGDLAPPWQLSTAGRVDWTLRNHRNHFELIRSDYLLVRR